MIKSINPYNQEMVYEISEFGRQDIDKAIDRAELQYKLWKEVPFSERSVLMRAAGEELRKTPVNMPKSLLRRWESLSFSH